MNIKEELSNKQQQEQAEQQNPWYEYKLEDNERLLNETIVTLKLTKKHYRTAWVLAHMLGDILYTITVVVLWNKHYSSLF